MKKWQLSFNQGHESLQVYISFQNVLLFSFACSEAEARAARVGGAANLQGTARDH